MNHKKTMNWSLEVNPPTFDILGALIIAKTLDYEHVTFNYAHGLHSLKYSPEETWRRVHRMAIPLVELCGMTWDIQRGNQASPWRGSYEDVEVIYRENGSVHKLVADPTPLRDYVTLTLRNMPYQLHRNSGPVWLEIKAALEAMGERVIIVPDDISVKERLDLYCGAKMNMGPTTGPMALCHFSDAPYLTFRMVTEGDKRMEKFFNKGIFKVGSQFSFRGPRQAFVWEPDDYDTVIRHYSQMMQLHQMAA